MPCVNTQELRYLDGSWNASSSGATGEEEGHSTWRGQEAGVGGPAGGDEVDERPPPPCGDEADRSSREAVAPLLARDFSPAVKFGGKMPGFTFKTGQHGLGYYREGRADEGGDVDAVGGAAALEGDKEAASTGSDEGGRDVKEGSQADGLRDPPSSGVSAGREPVPARARQASAAAARAEAAHIGVGMDWLSKAAESGHPLGEYWGS